MTRRCYLVRLDAKCSSPFLREGPVTGTSFRIADLKAWVHEHRGQLLAALLTLARAWYVAGKPKPTIKPIGSFVAWTTTIGGILQFAGINGFMANASALYDEGDDEAREWEGFLLTLREVFYGEPFTVALILEKLAGKTSDYGNFASESSNLAKKLQAALPDFLSGGKNRDRDGDAGRSIGRAFSSRVDRRFGKSGVHLKKGTLLNGRQQWQVIYPDQGQTTEGID